MQGASATRNDAIPSVGSEVLAEGLMLVRASTLKVIRLQLAMERRDRRVALEAVDDLVALDRSLEQFLMSVPAADDDGLFGNVLELERSALNVEKHTLAAGISNRGWQVEAAEPEIALEAEAEADWTYDEVEGESRNWRRTAAIIAAILVIACAAYLLGASGLVPGFIREVL
jgi:hypothetical protein